MIPAMISAAMISTAMISAAVVPAATTRTLGGLAAADRSTVEHEAVHLRERPLTRIGVGERDEAKAPRTARVSIKDHRRVSHRAELLECCAKGSLVGPPGESTNEQFHAFLISMARWIRGAASRTGARTTMTAVRTMKNPNKSWLSQSARECAMAQ